MRIRHLKAVLGLAALLILLVPGLAQATGYGYGDDQGYYGRPYGAYPDHYRFYRHWGHYEPYYGYSHRHYDCYPRYYGHGYYSPGYYNHDDYGYGYSGSGGVHLIIQF